jgi:WXG100 family type VII secretion target
MFFIMPVFDFQLISYLIRKENKYMDISGVGGVGQAMGSVLGGSGGGSAGGTQKVDHEQMQTISKQFQSNGDEMLALLNQTKQKVEALRGNQWQGDAADKFFIEMEQTVLPAFQRLVDSLHQSSQVALKITQTIQQAEAESKSVFSNLV